MSQAHGRGRARRLRLRRHGRPTAAQPPRRTFGSNLRLVFAVALFVVLVVLSAAAWWQWRQAGDALPAPGALRGANLLLVTIDTLRADRVGAPGLTPTLDALASAGLRFTNAYAHAPVTLPSHASMMTGLTPLGHGVRNNGSYRLAAAHVTLAELLKAAGYRTGAFVGAFVLDSQFGLNQGFDEYDDRFSETQQPFDFDFVERRADEVLAQAADWILSETPHTERAGQAAATKTPWFAWTHLFDPHFPYNAPEPRVSDPYDNEVAFTDAQLGRFLERLRQAGELAHTLVVITADHGEDLGDHGEFTHSLFAYNSTLKVPLILSAPGIRPAIRQSPVSHMDILPSVADLLGLEVPSAVQGRSLRPALNGADMPPAPIYFEALSPNTRNWAPLTGIVADGWKFIDLPIPELYDLNADPQETTNLFDRDPERSHTLLARLEHLRLQLAARESAGTLPVDPETVSRLQALGYTTTRARRDSPDEDFTEADDPKTVLELHLKWERVKRRLANAFRTPPGLEAAIPLLEEIVSQHPHFAPAYSTTATVLIELGRASEAVTLLEEAWRRDVRTNDIRERLSVALLRAEEPARAATMLEPLVAGDLAWADDVNKLGVAYVRQGRTEAARRQFLRAVEIDPTAAEAWKNLGVLEMQTGNPENAYRAFREATEADPSYGLAWRLLGAVLRPADAAGAIAAWRRAVDLTPDDVDALLDLTALLFETGSPQEARPYLERYLANPHPDEDPARIERVRQRLTALETR